MDTTATTAAAAASLQYSPEGEQQESNIYDLFDQCTNINGLLYDPPMAEALPFVEIIEQPAKCALRFRYKCEGRSAGSLPGVNSTQDNKTYPTIRINNYIGRAVVVVSCVTKDAPYRAHPHNIVGKEGCKKGICTIVLNNNQPSNNNNTNRNGLNTDGAQVPANTADQLHPANRLQAPSGTDGSGSASSSISGSSSITKTFHGLGIQCVKRKDIEDSLNLRESINVDPFRNGFMHKLDTANFDLNVVRLCFQVFIEGSTPNKCDVPLTPVVSEPVHDKKAMSDLVITRLSHCSAPATGGREVILLCDRINKDDIRIRFFEERQGATLWETFVEVTPADLHKQVGIIFKTPKYYDENITHPVMARIQLQRISDNQVSEPRQFQFLPCESDVDIISRKRQKIEWVSNNQDALNIILQQQQQQQSPSSMNHQPPQQQQPQHHHHHHHLHQHLPQQQQHQQHHQQQQQQEQLHYQAQPYMMQPNVLAQHQHEQRKPSQQVDQ